MKEAYDILRIGSQNWAKELELTDKVNWHFFSPNSSRAIQKVMKMDKIRRFHAIILEDISQLTDLLAIEKSLTPYTIFYPAGQENQNPSLEDFIKRTCARPMDMSDRAEFVRTLTKSLFHGQYGDKMRPIDMVVSPTFQGRVCYNGYENLELLGHFGDDYKPILSWKYNMPAYQSNPLEVWLEYEKDPICQIRLKIQSIQEGSTATIASEEILTEEDMEEAKVLDNDFTSFVSVTLEAKGSGLLKVGALHLRFSRYQFGKYVLGGKILRDAKRQEINYFFDPADLKPPLAIYFSGYRKAEGFESYGLMKSLGCPFLLFSDPRIEGGAFYLGSQELEGKIQQVIQEHLDLLGFSQQDLVFSGISMGTYGAVYHAASFRPKAIILGKPLGNLGTITQRERLLSPGIFKTSLDLLRRHTGGNSQQDIEDLDQRFWQKFEKADFSQTVFAMAYMKEEDYDPTAYDDLIKVLYPHQAKVISKGTSGRHNDDTSSTVIWFVNYYKNIFSEYFGRKF